MDCGTTACLMLETILGGFLMGTMRAECMIIGALMAGIGIFAIFYLGKE